ncbi:MAG: CRISPR-associated endonuclease Cas1, partial [Candidatus Heimdallarchaeaceae archaeon]
MVIIVLSSHGTKLGKKKEMFKITRPETEYQEELFAAETIEEIIIESTGSISTEAIKLASRYAIPILFIYGNEPIACLTPFASHGTVKVRREQIKAYETNVGVRFCKEIIKAATDNKIKIIKEMVRVRKLGKNIEETIREEINKMENLKTKVTEIKKEKIDECREEIFTRESEITKIYYSCLQ